MSVTGPVLDGTGAGVAKWGGITGTLADQADLQSALNNAGGGSSWEFPVGYILISTVNTNPSTFLGYGTWSSFGAGRVMVGLDGTQTEFDAAEETGGSKTHTLQVSEIPSHTHIQDAHTHVQNAFAPRIINSGTAGTVGVQGASAASNANASNAGTTATNQNATATNQSTGGGGAHNNLQPYIVTYFWKRTA